MEINRKNYKWMSLKDEEIDEIVNNFSVIPPKAKKYFDVKPFFSITLTKQCTLRCKYCGEGGEATLSKMKSHDINVLEKRLYQLAEVGINKIRLTGGEPFLYKDMEKILRLLKELDLKMFVLVNTNGTVNLDRYLNLLSDIDAKVVVHLDTPDRYLYSKITSYPPKAFDIILENINKLYDYGILHRFNAVISKYNRDMYFDIVEFAQKYETNLKSFDVVEVPKPFIEKSETWVPIDDIIKRLEEMSDNIFDHPYARAFGTPVKVYDVNGTLVSIKYTKHGSRYDPEGYCKNCPFFPCDEGLYDILYYPDDTIWGCRWRRPKELTGDFEKDLKYLVDRYQNTKWFVGNRFVEK